MGAAPKAPTPAPAAPATPESAPVAAPNTAEHKIPVPQGMQLAPGHTLVARDFPAGWQAALQQMRARHNQEQAPLVAQAAAELGVRNEDGWILDPSGKLRFVRGVQTAKASPRSSHKGRR